MRPATASRLARLVPAVLAVGLVLAACVTTAAPGWTFEPPPTASAPAAATGSAAPSGIVGASASAPGSAPASAPASAPGSAPASAPGSAPASAPGSAPASAPASALASPVGSAAAGDVVKISATNTLYDQKEIEAKAGVPFQISFTNNDAGIPHNVQIAAPDGSQPFKGAIFTGAGTTTYDVPALAAGTYTFSCVVHPTMTGTLTVK